MPTPIKFPATVMSITAHGRSTYTLLLQPQRRVPGFRPGQFAHLAIDPYDPGEHWPESRVFSIASSPNQRELLRFTYGVQGMFTRRMEKELTVGREVWVKLPYGEFTFDALSTGDREVALIAGGTGFTPFACYLEYLLDGSAAPPLRIMYGAAQPSLLVFHDLARLAKQRLPNVRALFFLEQGAEGDILSGRMNIMKLWEILDRPEQACFYLSGPKGMIDAHTADLTKMGISTEQIRIDKWE